MHTIWAKHSERNQKNVGTSGNVALYGSAAGHWAYTGRSSWWSVRRDCEEPTEILLSAHRVYKVPYVTAQWRPWPVCRAPRRCVVRQSDTSGIRCDEENTTVVIGLIVRQHGGHVNGKRYYTKWATHPQRNHKQLRVQKTYSNVGGNGSQN